MTFKLTASGRCCALRALSTPFYFPVAPADQLTMIVIIVAVAALTLSIGAIVSEYLAFFSHLKLGLFSTVLTNDSLVSL